MKLLLDQDVYATTARFLRESGHDVLFATEIGLSRGTDSQILRGARDQERLLVTRDRDFGSLVFVTGERGGVIYLRRLSASTLRMVHEELAYVLSSYSEDELKSAFVVVEPRRHRIRRLSR